MSAASAALSSASSASSAAAPPLPSAAAAVSVAGCAVSAELLARPRSIWSPAVASMPVRVLARWSVRIIGRRRRGMVLRAVPRRQTCSWSISTWWGLKSKPSSTYRPKVMGAKSNTPSAHSGWSSQPAALTASRHGCKAGEASRTWTISRECSESRRSA
eukprot:13350099-Alexandrium_andersonii.AAC.1